VPGSGRRDFQTAREFDSAGGSSPSHTDKAGYLPYEGKMIYQFEHNYQEPRYFASGQQGIDALIKKELKRIKKLTKNLSQE